MRCYICDVVIEKPEWDEDNKHFYPCLECQTWVEEALKDFLNDDESDEHLEAD